MNPRYVKSKAFVFSALLSASRSAMLVAVSDTGVLLGSTFVHQLPVRASEEASVLETFAGDTVTQKYRSEVVLSDMVSGNDELQQALTLTKT